VFDLENMIISYVL